MDIIRIFLKKSADDSFPPGSHRKAFGEGKLIHAFSIDSGCLCHEISPAFLSVSAGEPVWSTCEMKSSMSFRMILFVYFPFNDFAGDLHSHTADLVFQFVDRFAFS